MLSVFGDSTSPNSRVRKPCRSPTRHRKPRGAPRASNQARNPLRILSTDRQARAKTTERKESGMMRPLVRRQTIDADIFKMHTGMRTMGPDPFGSHAAPHGDTHSRRQSLRSNGAQITANDLEPEDINDKIRRMLAATEALKPGSSQVSGLRESRRSRIVPSKVLKKISSAWGKIHAKNTGQCTRLFG